MEKGNLTGSFHKDGSFSVYRGQQAILKNCYPGMDGRSIRAERGEPGPGNAYTWITDAGTVHARMEECDQGFLLYFTLEEFQKMPHTFHFFYQADMEAEGFYQAAGAMGEETGYLLKEELSARRYTKSRGLCVLNGGKEGAVAVYTSDQKHYESLYEAEAAQEYPDGAMGQLGNGRLLLSASVRLEHIPKAAAELPVLKFRLTDSVSEGLKLAAEEIGRNMEARLTQPPAYHWCSWYYYYHNFSMNKLEGLLEDFDKLEESPGLRYIQIDAGYFPSPGDWLEPGNRFPEGLKPAFESILAHGYIPGIWVAPFMVGNRSGLYKEHPEWVLKSCEDKPIVALIADNEPKLWGYQDEEYYILDTSHPDAAEYMKHVFKTLHQWGAGMFKTDFMLWGFQDSSRVKRYRTGKTSVEYLRDFLQLIREAIGEESYLLACIAPFLPCVGYVDAMRIGSDVGSDWNGEFGPRNMLKSLAGNYYMNHRYFQNDPDAVMLRDFHIRLSQREVEGLALAAAMSGGCIYTSDPLYEISGDRRKLFSFIRPDIRRSPELPYLTKKRRELVMVQRSAQRALIYILNPTQETVISICSMEELGFDSSWSAFEFAQGRSASLWKGCLETVLQPHAYSMYFLSKEKDAWIDRENLWCNLGKEI